MTMRRALFCLGFVCLIAAKGFAEKKSTISISGSDTMLVLTQRLAEEFMKKNPGVEISVTGGGSGRGIADITEGLVDIAQASRKMKAEEIQKAKDNGYDAQEHVVALDGIAIAVNAANPVKEISLAQLRAIYSGAVKKWNELDASLPADDIVVFSREANCGTYDFFKEHVLQKGDFSKNTSYLAATAAIVNAVGKDKNAIGFGGVAYFTHGQNIHVLPVKELKEKPAVLPVSADGKHVNAAAIRDGSYPISRPLQFYTRETPSGYVKAFLDWSIGAEGQAIVQMEEYIPLNSTDAK